MLSFANLVLFFFLKTIFDTQSDQFFTFYTNIPLIRIYKDFKLVKEIWTMDSFDTDINNFYDEKSKIFYVKPHIRNGKIYVVYINKNLDDFSKDPSKNLLVFDTQGALIKRYKINKDFQSYTISEDETEFYGIDNSDPNHTVIFKGKL